MKKLTFALMITMLLAVAAWAANVVCPLHYNAPCFFTGRLQFINGKTLHEYHCTCGDNYWVIQ